MANWRVSLVFRNAVGATSTSGSLFGWTENVYSRNSMTPDEVSAAADALVLRRRSILTPGWRIARVRFSQFPFNRVAFSPGVAPSSGVGLYPLGSNVGDEQPYDKLLMNAVCESGKSRALEFGGIGSDVVDAGGVYLAPGAFTAALPALGVHYGTYWAVNRNSRARQLPIYAVYLAPTGDMLDVSNVAPGLWVGTGPDQLVAGTKIRVTGSRGVPFLNGVWTIDHLTTLSGSVRYVLRPKRGLTLYGGYLGGGQLLTYAQSFDPFAAMTPVRGTSRRTGGSIDRPRGRRSTRRS